MQVYDAAPAAAGAPATAGGGNWVPFHLWPAQVAVADILQRRRLVVLLKARQLGMSWLTVAYGLWLMIFRPAATVLFFSKRDEEAVHLLNFRLRGMYARLPEWMRAAGAAVDNSHALRLSNGSAALAFPTTGGRSYTATLAVVDEADHVSRPAGTSADLEVLLDAVKPTVDAGGALVLLSTVDKRTPGSAFKRIYEGAVMGANAYQGVFLPWSARPDRDAAWYAGVQRDILARSGTLDSLYAEYPATDVEALAPLTSDARFAAAWLSAADGTREWSAGDALAPGRPQASGRPQGSPLPAAPVVGAGLVPAPSLPNVLASGRPQGSPLPVGAGLVPAPSLPNIPAPSLPNLAVFEGPQPGRMYVIGADPAEGNPQSDESAACVLDAVTGDQAAVWAGRFEPATFAAGLQTLADWYRSSGGTCGLLVERNNHGHAVLLALREAGVSSVLNGLDGQRGWLTSGKGKALAVDAAADLLRDGALGCGPGLSRGDASRGDHKGAPLQGGHPRVRDAETLRQLRAFSGSSLAAPAGDHDDRAMAWILAAAAAKYCPAGSGASAVIPPAWAIDPRETGGW